MFRQTGEAGLRANSMLWICVPVGMLRSGSVPVGSAPADTTNRLPSILRGEDGRFNHPGRNNNYTPVRDVDRLSESRTPNVPPNR